MLNKQFVLLLWVSLVRLLISFSQYAVHSLELYMLTCGHLPTHSNILVMMGEWEHFTLISQVKFLHLDNAVSCGSLFLDTTSKYFRCVPLQLGINGYCEYQTRMTDWAQWRICLVIPIRSNRVEKQVSICEWS